MTERAEEEESQRPAISGSLHSESTIAAAPSNSTLRTSKTSELSSAEFSETSGPSGSDSDLRFAKRSIILSEESRQQKLKTFRVLESQRRSLELFPVSKLRFSSLGLVGRDDQVELLNMCLKRVVPQDKYTRGSRELVLVSGNAGTGKTVLALALQKSVKRLGGLYVKGKFDLYLRDEPYSGIAAACREVCGRILQLKGSKSFVKIQTELVDKLGSENLCLLINIIPELLEIVGDSLNMEDIKNTQGSEEAKARLNYAFRIFVRAIASYFGPLIILLDDVQWSDAATLDLLQVLIADGRNRGLMVIAVYRSSEGDESHPLAPILQELKRTAEQDDFNLTEIEIDNLNASQINEILMRLLSIDEPEKTLELADICLKRTLGNAFSLRVFLEMLQEEGLLQYNLGQLKWNWDEQNIMLKTAATSNVVDLMKNKIDKLPASIGQRLSIAACLGFSIEPDILNTVWRTITQQQEVDRDDGKEYSDEEQDEIQAFLDLAEREGFLEIEADSTSTYRWVHDKLQEAAMSLVPSDELPSLKAQVGKILVNELGEKALDSYIFTAVSLLHEGEIPDDDKERIKLVELSLKASNKAADQSAFESARKYATIGVEVLPANSWSNHYKLTLDLYSTAAEVACSLGKIDQLETYYNEVLDHKEGELFGKLRVYHAMISYKLGALGTENNIKAIEIITRILAELGLHFPMRKAARSRATKEGTRKATRMMTSLQPEDITTLPMMDDPVHLEMMSILDQLFTAAYMSGSDLMPLTIFARIELTLEHGLCEYSALAFAGLALLLRDSSSDPKLASKTGGFARLAMEIVDSKNRTTKAELWLNAFVFCWTDPIARVNTRFVKAYETGLSVGDNENACWCIAQYIVINFQSGRPLETVEADCICYMKQMLEFQREVCHTDINIYLEMVQNLMGRSEGTPTVMKSDERFRSHGDHTVLGVFYSCQCILYLYFGEYEKGAQLAIERDDAYATGIQGHVWIMIETFTRAMLLYAMARKSKKRMYKKQAKKVHKTIKSWVRKGNPNVQHYDLLLNAESAVLAAKLDAAEGWYQSAIVSATRQGHIHESAFASECYGEFLLNVRNDPEEARHKFDDAIQRYSEWGAAKKVLLLREKHEVLWSKPTEVAFKS